jgi:uncharacterized protein YacL
MLHALRVIFILFCAGVGWYIAGDPVLTVLPHLNDAIRRGTIQPWHGLIVFGLVGTLLVILEWGFTRRFVSVISVVMFGLLVGLVFSALFTNAIELIPAFREIPPALKSLVHIVLTFFFCYLSMVAILQSKDDFKFVIPFIELSREGRRGRPWVIDTSVIIDGRIADLAEAKVLDAPLVVPRFVLDELQQVADSADRTKRNRGRRGLDILNRLRKNRALDVQINEVRLPEVEGVDAKLMRLARMIDARLVTNDFNLNKVAQVQGIEVFNMNDLANALRAPVLPGEGLVVKIVKVGEESGQGVGYLEDGTMVVVEGCARRVGEMVPITVTSVIQRSAGRMVFGRPGQSSAEVPIVRTDAPPPPGGPSATPPASPPRA